MKKEEFQPQKAEEVYSEDGDESISLVFSFVCAFNPFCFDVFCNNDIIIITIIMICNMIIPNNNEDDNNSIVRGFS